MQRLGLIGLSLGLLLGTGMEILSKVSFLMGSESERTLQHIQWCHCALQNM